MFVASWGRTGFVVDGFLDSIVLIRVGLVFGEDFGRSVSGRARFVFYGASVLVCAGSVSGEFAGRSVLACAGLVFHQFVEFSGRDGQ